MSKFYLKNVSSLEKVLPELSLASAEYNKASCLKGESFSYQLAFIGVDVHGSMRADVEIESDLADKIEIFDVSNVPVCMPAYAGEFDAGYITRESAILPDVLTPYDKTLCVSQNCYKAAWVKVNVTEDVPCGIHEIKIKLTGRTEDKPTAEAVFNLEVIDAVLPKQKLIFTQWFHCDCISSYYNVKPLSEEHWELIENFASLAAKNGINMLLTPIFTPPLDTAVGKERPTVQLIDVEYDGQKYTFKFDKLKRWMDMCRKLNIEYLEMAHLYTQWGALCAPKVVVKENGKEVTKFGWHTDSMGDEYKDFLSRLLPALTDYLKENWDPSKIYFHLSDEPSKDHIKRYGEIHEFFAPLIKGFRHMDAISDYEIYEKGFIDDPVAVTRTVNDFMDHNVSDLWTYYCCGEGKYNLSNRFIAMPSYRNRIMGTQLYKFNIKGFLQWGYNFYYSQFSEKIINPYLITDSDGAFPAGDAFTVYPGRDGALPSIRLFVFADALRDMQAMIKLEELAGRDEVIKIIDESGNITFNDYPDNGDYILKMREKINARIKELI